jgi:hypothetical protein
MKKLLVLGLVVVGIGLGANPKFRAGAARAWRNVGTWFECREGSGCDQHVAVPKGAEARKQSIERVRKDIARLDSDVQALLGPIAEKQVALRRMEADIKTAQANHKQRREDLLALTKLVKAGTESIHFQDEDYTLQEAKDRLTVDFADFKNLDAGLKAREQLLAAQKKSIRLAREQLARIVEQKRNFEVRLAQLEVTEEHLNLEEITTPLRTDRGRVAAIKNRLDAIQQSQDVAREIRNIAKEFLPRGSGNSTSNLPPVNPDDILNFLNGPRTTGAPSVASTKKTD